ncbi:hypothetical protein ANO11243_006070 [Dothideomycetidae sp. 11243]|nr:hypothetical protein ANO11243_006070 [fungal sp. No.11243]
MTLHARLTDPDYHLYPWNPIKPLPYFFAVLLFLLGTFNLWQHFIKWKWSRFGFIMAWASSVWVAGFICLSISQNMPESINIYIAQYVLVLVGPPLYGAAETFVLGRLMAYLPYHAPMHPGRVLTTFAILSAAVESLSAHGAAVAASAASPFNLSLLNNGLDFLNAALLLQCIVESLFLFLNARLHMSLRKAGPLPRHVQTMIYVLYVTSSMVLVRGIYRAVQGFESKRCENSDCGKVVNSQAMFWIFEVSNITLFVIALTIFTPGRYLPPTDRVFLDPTDRTTERLGPGFAKADRRLWLITILDPFDILGKMKGKKTICDPFWDEPQPVYEGDARHYNERVAISEEVGLSNITETPK